MRGKNKFLNCLKENLIAAPADRTKEILQINPTIVQRAEAEEVQIAVYDYNADEINTHLFHEINQCVQFKNNNHISWINIDGIRKADIEEIGNYYGIHPLLIEDILSVNQRAKVDEIDNMLFCLLNMLYFNDEECQVESEQVSIILTKDTVISVQEDAKRDVFNMLRTKLQFANSKIRSRDADYLLYSMLDLIVDNYFLVMEKLSNKIELVEERIVKGHTNKHSLAQINQLRKELIVLKRNIMPVRDLVNSIIRSESVLIDERTTKYFKDIYDHIVQAFELSENYHDVILSMQDLYLSNVSLKMNEVMKVMAVVTCLLAPATVIGGIFGMNFDRIPYLHNHWGFYWAVGFMLIIPIGMLFIFRRRGWF